MIRTIHPFPARMAPDIALEGLKWLQPDSVVLDPMAGSGTVLRHAIKLGHNALGFDLDPLAVLMAKVWTNRVSDKVIEKVTKEVLSEVADLTKVKLPWIDQDEETLAFTKFWFHYKQRKDIRRFAYVLDRMRREKLSVQRKAAMDVLRVALSRIIITKNTGASLAWDVSHSRPHKVMNENNYDVVAGFQKSVEAIRVRLLESPPEGGAHVRVGDARKLNTINDGSVDAVLTSPPYLNALDYLRGHRLSLVWLGFRLSELRSVRSKSIGAEKGPDKKLSAGRMEIVNALGDLDLLPQRQMAMIGRYATDLHLLLIETSRVLSESGKATFVVGDSCLRGVFVKNSSALLKAAELAGLRLSKKSHRALPSQHRYLPTPDEGSLGKRMRMETVLTFKHA